MRPRVKRMLMFAPVAIVGLMVFAFIGGEVVRLLWNWLLPPLFGFPLLTFWQALGLLALCRILFGGLGRHGGPGSHYGRRCEAMTPEERERIRERIRTRMGAE